MLKDITNALTNKLYRKYDEYSLALHLIEDHGLCDKVDFKNSYELLSLKHVVLKCLSYMNIELLMLMLPTPD